MSEERIKRLADLTIEKEKLERELYCEIGHSHVQAETMGHVDGGLVINPSCDEGVLGIGITQRGKEPIWILLPTILELKKYLNTHF